MLASRSRRLVGVVALFCLAAGLEIAEVQSKAALLECNRDLVKVSSHPLQRRGAVELLHPPGVWLRACDLLLVPVELWCDD
jgi:hypothetical protein